MFAAENHNLINLRIVSSPSPCWLIDVAVLSPMGEFHEARARNDHRMHLWISANLLVVRGYLVYSPIASPLFQQLLTAVTNSHQLGSGVKIDPGNVVIVADGSRADDRDADGIRFGK